MAHLNLGKIKLLLTVHKKQQREQKKKQIEENQQVSF